MIKIQQAGQIIISLSNMDLPRVPSIIKLKTPPPPLPPSQNVVSDFMLFTRCPFKSKASSKAIFNPQPLKLNVFSAE